MSERVYIVYRRETYVQNVTKDCSAAVISLILQSEYKDDLMHDTTEGNA